jgi:hypothetical protein
LDGQLFVFGGIENFLQQFSNHLMTHGGDADSLAGAQQFADHSRSGVGLARTRRALYGQDVVIQVHYKAPSLIHDVGIRIVKVHGRRMTKQ